MSQYAGSETTSGPHEIVRAQTPIAQEFAGLTEALNALDSSVEVLSARLGPVLTPSEGTTMAGRIEEQKRTSPVAEQIHHVSRELERIGARVNELISSLEV